MTPTSTEVYSYTRDAAGNLVRTQINQDNVETILDAMGNIDKVFIHASITNPVETEIRYRYGKVREIYENGILSKKYSYEYLADGTEIVVIESVAKNLIERYQNGILQSSFDPITEVLTTFVYDVDGKKALAVKSRKGEEIERYEYTYFADKIVVKDKSGKISEFDPVTEKILREIVTDEKGNISTFEYTHTKNDFLLNENPFELSAVSSQPSAKSFDIAGYPNAEFYAHDGLYLYYHDKTTGETHRLGPDFDYVDASGQVKPLDTVIAANVPIPSSPFKDKEDEFKQMYPDAKFVFADGSFIFIIKDSEVLAYRQEEGDMVRGWTFQNPENFEQVFYDWIHNEIWIKKENENVFRRLGGLRDLDGHETSRRELAEIVTTDGTKVRYKDGQVEEITKPDGTRVRNLVTDEAGNVVFAKYFNTDGSAEEIQGNTSIEIPQPDFSKKIYTRGKLEKWILVDGREIVYTYEATAAGEKTFAKLGDWTYVYAEDGKLTEARIGAKSYSATQDGTRVILTNRDEKITFGAGRQVEEYENLRTHAKVYFQNGDLVRIEENNQTTNFELGEIVGLDYEQNTSATEGFQASVLVGADPRVQPYVRVKQPVTVSYPNGGYHFTITNQGVIDLNGDGIDDKVTVDSLNYPGVWKIEFGKADGTFQSAIDWGPVENIQYRIGAQGRLSGWAMEIFDMDIGGYTTMLVDVNGDRLPDRVETMGKTTNDFKFESQGIYRVQFNNGHGFDNPVDWSNIDTIIPASQAGSQIYFGLAGDKNSKTTVAFRDINGDGLADRIQAAADGTWKIQSNTGTGMDEMRSWTGVEHPDWASDLYDVNGDGLLDRIMRDPNTNQWYVQYNNNYPYLIHSANANKADVLTVTGRFQFYARTLLPFVNVMENLRLDMPKSEIDLSPDKVTTGAKLTGGTTAWSTKTLSDGRQFFYESGTLVRIKDAEGKFSDVLPETGNVTVLKDVDGERRFDASGNLISITLPSGEMLVASAGKLTGRFGTYSLSSEGKITGFTPTDAAWPETFAYENGSLAKLVNGRGEALSFTADNQLSTITLPSGETLSNFNLSRVPFNTTAVFGVPQEISVSTRNILETQPGGYTSSDLIDMNGDGILDRVTQSVGTRNYFEVEYGTGQGFLAPKPFTGVENYGDAKNGWIRWVEDGIGVRVDMFDINGDGLPDRVVSDPYNYKNLETDTTKPPRYQETWHVQLNNGSGFNPAENWSFEIPGRVTGATKYPNMPAYKSHIRYYMAGDWTCSGNCNDPDQGVRASLTLMADVNGDGRPDRVTQLQEADPMYVQLNNGHGFDAAVVWSDKEEHYDRYVRYDWQTHFYTGDQSIYLDLRDINGDGIADRVFNPRGQNTFWMIEEGLASGGFSPMRSIQVPVLSADYPNSDWGDSLGRTDVMDLMDINADGLADRIYQSWSDTRTFVQINNGVSFDPVVEWKNTPNLVLHPKSVTDWYSQNVTDSFIDVTGDGLPDKVWKDAATGKWMMQENRTSPIADRIELFRALERTKQLEQSNFALEKLTNHQAGFSFLKLTTDGQQLSALNNLSQYTLSADAVAVSEYDESGNLLAVKKANGTTTLYDGDKPLSVLNAFGELEIRYEYDTNGDPTRIKMETARRRLPLEIERAKQQVEAKRLEALLKLASQKAVAVRDIRTKVLSARLELEHALEELKKQQAYVSNLNTRGAKQIATIKANALAQINGALGTVYSTFTDIAHKEADAIAGVFSQVSQLQNQVETDSQTAFQEIETQRVNFEKEVIRQEISPIIYNYFRKILGRDPSKAEYDDWIAKTDFMTGMVGPLGLADALRQLLESSSEKGARESEIAAIKTEISLRIQSLASISPAQKSALIVWINKQNLHFGQSNWRSLEMLLQAAGTQFDRIDLIVKLVMADIEASVINAYDITQRDELQLSAYAMQKVAEDYGLAVTGMKLSFNELQAGDIVHVNGDHFVRIKTMGADKITYVDPSIGPSGAEEVIEIAKDEFLKIWQGTVIAPRTPPQNAQILTDRELQSIRGAGFFLFDIFKKIWKGFTSILDGVFNAIKSVVNGIVGGIKNLFAGLGGFVGNLLKGDFTQAFSSLFTGVTGAFGSVFGGLTSGFGNLTKGLLESASEIPFFGKTISKKLQYLTENGFSTQNVLVALGFSPKVAATIVNSGKIAIGAAMLITGNPAGLSFIGDGTAGILQTNTHLSPYAIQGIRFGSQLAGGFVTGGPAGAGTAFQNIFPQIAGTFSAMGISQLGDNLGLDSRVTALLSAGGSMLASSLAGNIVNRAPTQEPGDSSDPSGNPPPSDPGTGGTGDGTQPPINIPGPGGTPSGTNGGGWFQALSTLFNLAPTINNFLRGIFGSSSNQTVNPDPGTGSNPQPITNAHNSMTAARDLSGIDLISNNKLDQVIEDAYDAPGMLVKVRSRAEELMPPAFVGAKVTGTSYEEFVKQNGLAYSLDRDARYFFSQKTVEKMMNGSGTQSVKSFIEQRLTQGPVSDVNVGGKILKRLELVDDVFIEYDASTQMPMNISDIDQGLTIQDLRLDSIYQKPYLVKGELIQSSADGKTFFRSFAENGELKVVEIERNQNLAARITPADGKTGITFNASGFYDYNVQQYQPPASWKVLKGIVTEMRNTEYVTMGNETVPMEVLIQNLENKNPILQVIANNLSQHPGVDQSMLATVLKVVVDQLKQVTESSGNLLYLNDNGKLKRITLSDLFQKEDVDRKAILDRLDVPEGRPLDVENDLGDFVNKQFQFLGRKENEIDAIRDQIRRIRENFSGKISALQQINPSFETTAYDPQGNAVIKTTYSSGLEYQGSGDVEMNIGFDGEVFYSETAKGAINVPGYFEYTNKSFKNADGVAVKFAGQDYFEKGKVTEIKLLRDIQQPDGSTVTVEEELHVEVAEGNVDKDGYFLIIRKKTGSVYSQSVSFIKVPKNTPDETADENQKVPTSMKDLLEGIMKIILSGKGTPKSAQELANQLNIR
ncbi:MAG: hypothetical protein HZC17_08055 [Candidatus Omnitrophica bacterium]|nr:hypothetical protein [Candidatus Omnitrophota bacterium]